MSYPASWHQLYGKETGVSAEKIVSHLISIFPVRSSIEIGCGNAHWTRSLLSKQIDLDYVVADGPWNKLSDLLVDKRNFLEIDLTKKITLPKRFDILICLEVAEHVAEEFSENVIETLISGADIIIFGAAIPFQGGFGHVNEQWPSYWRKKFLDRKYVAFDLIRPQFWQDKEVHYWYRQNMFVYIHESNIGAMQKARSAEQELYKSNFLFDAVHPEKFAETASYSSISIKRLLPKLPSWAWNRIKGSFA
jgi:hypothetical protein